MGWLADVIDEAIMNHANESELTRIKQDVMSMCERYPLYGKEKLTA